MLNHSQMEMFEFNLHWILIVNSVSQFSGLDLLSAIYPKRNQWVWFRVVVMWCVLVVKPPRSITCFFPYNSRISSYSIHVPFDLCFWTSDGVRLQNNGFHSQNLSMKNFFSQTSLFIRCQICLKKWIFDFIWKMWLQKFRSKWMWNAKPFNKYRK